MKKNFLFAMLAVFLAWFWFGGVSMADEETPSTPETPTESSSCQEEATYWTNWCDTLANAIKSANVGDTITLLGDITLDEDVIISRNINIDLWTHKIEGNWKRFAFINWANSEIWNWTIINTTKPAIQIEGWANVTIKDWNFTSTNASALVIINGSTLTIDNAKVKAQEVAVLAYTNANVTINWGEYETVDNFVIWTNWSEWLGWSKITINWWTFKGNITSPWYIACWIYAPNDDTITVNWWTFDITNGVWVAIRAWNVNIWEKAIFKYTTDENISEWFVWDSKVKLPVWNKIVIDLRAWYPWLNDNTFKVESKKNNNDTFTNQLYVIEDTEPSFSSKDVDNAEITKKSWEYKVEIQWWTFSEDVNDYTVVDKCAVKNGENLYEIRNCPTPINFYTSSNNKIPVVVNEEWTIDLDSTKIAIKNERKRAEPKLSIETPKILGAKNTDWLEIIEIEWEKILFMDMTKFWWSSQTKWFSSSEDWIFFSKFQLWTDYVAEWEWAITYDENEKAIKKPKWVSTEEKTVAKYNEITKDGKVIWYTLKIWAPDFSWFYAPRLYKVTFNSDWGTEYEAQKVALTDWKATNPWIPTKKWYGFKFWSKDGKKEYKFEDAVDNDIELKAIYGDTDDAFTITWKNWNTTLKEDILAAGATPTYLWETPTKDADSSCKTYEFKAWSPAIAAVSADTTYTATFTCTSPITPSYSWGGGSSRNSSKTTTADDTKKAEETAKDEQKADESKSDETKADETKTSEEAKAAADAQALKDGYSQEFIDAYNFARKNNITTKDTIREADMDAPLTRIAMAKMLSQYAINVLGKTPDTSVVVPTFPDVDAKLDADYNNWVTLAYQLWIMWINVNKYRPFDLVTRAEFGTALSRMLFGLEDGEWNEWYSTHLAKLMEEQIITNNNPNLQELRGYVMIMLMRSAQ